MAAVLAEQGQIPAGIPAIEICLLCRYDRHDLLKLSADSLLPQRDRLQPDARMAADQLSLGERGIVALQHQPEPQDEFH